MPPGFQFRWTGQRYEEPAYHTSRIVNWDALLSAVRALSRDDECAFEGDFHAGGRHIVRRVVVPSRKTRWLARIPVTSADAASSNSSSSSDWWTSEREFAMRSEIATMKYVARNTRIPVPEVFSYNTGIAENPVGMPYVLMQCFAGNMLYDMGGHPSLLTLEQVKKINQDVASIQYQLFRAPLPQLGSLILNAEGEVDIGPLPSTFGFQGPFTTPLDYFLCWLAQHPELKGRERLESVVRKAITTSPSGHYPIIHPDFLMHNILFDDDLNVIGVIDWEHAHSAPPEVFAVRTNMFAQFDSSNGTVDWDDEGAHYAADIRAIEDKEEEDGKQDDGVGKLSAAFTSDVGLLGFCMPLYEKGRVIPFDKVLDRIEKELSRSERR